MRLLLLFVALLVVGSFAEKTRFDGHRLVSAEISTEEQRTAVEKLGLDAWSHDSNVVVGENHILLPPGLEGVLSDLGVPILDTLIEDVQKIIDQQEAERKPAADGDFFTAYHVFEEIVFETKRLAEEHSSLVTYIPSIGTSIQGRDLVAVVIHGGPSSLTVQSRGAFNVPTSVPKIVFTGGQHAREWISPATVMYIFNELVTKYGTDDRVTELLNKVAIVIVPVSNPDGYDFAWTNNRLWRKNRRRNSGGSFGVDLNRNWDTHWGGEGSSRSQPSDTYCGTGPFSEPESTAISTFSRGLGKVLAAVDWHSYSQLILRPWGWTRTPPPTDAALRLLGGHMREAIRETHGKLYVNEASWELYFTTGTASDWFFDKANISISYTIELRDTGRFGFVLPPAEIKPTGQESWEAALVLIETAAAGVAEQKL